MDVTMTFGGSIYNTAGPCEPARSMSESFCCRQNGLLFWVSDMGHHHCPVGLGEKAALLSPTSSSCLLSEAPLPYTHHVRNLP